jgi:hypothetical protein
MFSPKYSRSRRRAGFRQLTLQDSVLAPQSLVLTDLCHDLLGHEPQA